MSVFRFKQFSIEQDKCAMKIGTDAVLLGSWINCNDVDTCLDIGTGTGVIALMIAQRLSPAPFHISALEIDDQAAIQASVNFKSSKWNKDITLFHKSLQEFETTDQYSLIVSNPPFYNATLKPDDTARAVARHKDSLPIETIMRFSNEHLTEKGRLALIYPTAYDSEIMTAATLSGLLPIRICNIYTKQGKSAKRRMTEFMRISSTHPSLATENLYLRNNEGLYSLEYKTLTSDFYLSLK